MSLASIKTKQEQCLNDIYASLEEQGATIPDKKNLVNVAPAIESIEGGGSGPKFIDYIESTGTQYIDTGVKPTNNICVEIDFQYLGSNEPNNTWQPFFGFRDYYVKDDNKVKTSFCSYYNISTNELGYHFGPNEGTGTLNSGLNERKFLKYNNVGAFENGNQIITITNSGFETSLDNNTITIFALNINSADKTTGDSFMDPRRIHMKLYSFKVYESDVLIRNFKPCIDPNGVYCLYDLVEGKYYYNQGTGSFGGEGIPTQVINYKMLYDGSLGEAGENGANVCADVTGGFILNGHINEAGYTDGTSELQSTNIYMETSRDEKSSFYTQKTINITAFSKLCLISKGVFSAYGTNEWLSLFLGDVDDALNDTQTNRIGILGSKDGNKLVSMTDLSVAQIQNYYFEGYLVTAGNTSSNAKFYVYGVSLMKQDNWQELCTIAGLNASNYTDEATLCANSTAISTILNNEKAVEYMIYNCTGTFMGEFIKSSTALTELNKSPYKVLIYGNEHWLKFLIFVM